MGSVSLKRRLWTMASLAVVLPLGFLLKFYTGPGQDWLNNSVAGLAYVIFWCLVFFFVWPSRRAITPIVAGVLLVTCVLETLQLWHPPFLPSDLGRARRAVAAQTQFLGADGKAS